MIASSPEEAGALLNVARIGEGEPAIGADMKLMLVPGDQVEIGFLDEDGKVLKDEISVRLYQHIGGGEIVVHAHTADSSGRILELYETQYRPRLQKKYRMAFPRRRKR